MLLNSPWNKKQIIIKTYLEIHYNKNTTHPTMCDTAKMLLRGQEMKKFKNNLAKHI